MSESSLGGLLARGLTMRVKRVPTSCGKVRLSRPRPLPPSSSLNPCMTRRRGASRGATREASPGWRDCAHVVGNV